MRESDLNPEAPEFHPCPDLEMAATKATIKEGFNRMKDAVRTSNKFPIGTAYNQFQTFTEFNVIMSTLRNNLVFQCSSNIMRKELPSATLSRDDNEKNLELIVDANDAILDRLNVHMDTKSGENRASATAQQQQRAAQPAAWNREPVVATLKVRVGSASLIGAKNVPRPQLAFKQLVDNSESVFLPRIQEKPNSADPLQLTLLYNEAGEAIGYEHPYKAELEHHVVPEWALRPLEPPAVPPPPLDVTPLTLVNTPSQLQDLTRHLHTVREIAVDLEHHSYRTYQGITCLIQISTDEGGDFIVDALALRDELHALNQSFTDPTKVKVFHGAEQDVQWLQRDFGVYVVGMFDTHQAACLLGLEGRSLKYLLYKYCQIDADKTHQLADWRIRPLPDDLVKYARCDTHYLLYVWRRMQHDLLQHQQALVQHAFHMSNQVALTTYVKPVVRADSHLALYMRSRKRFRPAQLAAMRALWAWRDRYARALDESTTYLMPNHLLLALAEALPRDLQGLRALADPMPPFLNQNLHALHLILLQCREILDEPQGLSMSKWRDWREARDPLHSAHDFVYTHTSLGESNFEQMLVNMACEPFVTPPDVRAFSAPWLTPPASPCDTCLPDVQKCQLNAEAKTFLPPHERYQMYRGFLTEVQNADAIKHYESKLNALCESTVEYAGAGRPHSTHAPDTRPFSSHAPDSRPSMSHTSQAPYSRPSTSHAPYSRPSTSHAPYSRPSTSHAPYSRPSTSHAPDAQPSTSHASDSQPSTSHAPDAQPSTSHAPDTRPSASHEDGDDHHQRNTTETSQLKRKLRDEKLNPKKATDSENDKPVHICNNNLAKGKLTQARVQYKTANYKKFHQDGDERHKQPKRK